MDSTGWDRRYQASELVWGLEPNRFIAAEFAGLPPGRAVDIAAGEGRNAIWLAEHGWQVTAVDFSPVAIERGRLLAHDRGVEVDWVVADVRDYRPEPGSFDAVVVAYLHLLQDDLNPILNRAARALRPGGRILVVGHDVTNIDEGTGGPQDPDLLYTPQTIADQLAPLRVRHAERVRRPVPDGDAAVSAVDTLVVAVRL